eukprot:TRINITY_DN64974_c0_g1_i1.p1 TRINITY_DN64974_c0_g1~~TRINITY_DN64974_c0_g1_i1.p1  ORF type:complete len:599 (-),score=75.41 TRINITY_DN64974_c0_g1_i1:6-1802(-)
MLSSNSNQRALQCIHAYATKEMPESSVKVEVAKDQAAENQAEFSLNFDANVVLIVGGNGVGKTSLLTSVNSREARAVAKNGPYMVPNSEWRLARHQAMVLTPQAIIKQMETKNAFEIDHLSTSPSVWSRVYDEQLDWSDKANDSYPSQLAALFGRVFPGYVLWLHVDGDDRRVTVFDSPSASHEVQALAASRSSVGRRMMNKDFTGLTVCSSKPQKIKNTSGDGVRAVVALLLQLLYSDTLVLCIDELGHHLFPTQARALGRVIVRYMRERHQQQQPLQLVVTTHSTHLQHGMCSVLENDDDLHVVYITRNKDSTRSYHELTGNTLRQLRDSTKLSATPAVFDVFEHRLVVLVEGASDARLFRAAQPYATNNNNSNNNTSSTDERKSSGIESEVMWLEVGGKDQLGKVARVLQRLQVEVRIVTDFDILLPPGPKDAKSRLTQQLLTAVDAALRDKKTSMTISWGQQEPFKTNVDAYEKSAAVVTAVRGDVKALKTLVGVTGLSVLDLTPFRVPRKAGKKQGVNAVVATDKAACWETLHTLRKHGVYVISIGELESLCDRSVLPMQCPKKGEKFDNAVVDTIDRHPELIKFVQSVCSSL